jgi:hypothetical protein
MQPQPPESLDEPGRRLWSAILDEYELQPHELELLEAACHVADTVHQLQGHIGEHGLMAVTARGEPKISPALGELRRQQQLFARLLVALRVPLGDEEARAGQHRGTRGFYS